MASLSELMAFLEARLALPMSASEKDVPLLWRPASASADGYEPLCRVGLALEFSADVATAARNCDALFLHRPFRFPQDALPETAILSSHVGFDAHLTTGYNPALAAALGLRDIAPLFRADRPDEKLPIGMVGTIDPSQTLREWTEKVRGEFGGWDEATLTEADASVRRTAVMNALNPALVALAQEHGATVYITGQMRESARPAAAERGISLIAAGHARIEWWGLRRLAAEIKMAFPDIATTLFGE